MIGRIVLLGVIALGVIAGCSSKESGHDVEPPGGRPKLGVPKFIKDKNAPKS
jgi:hypothetical protein